MFRIIQIFFVLVWMPISIFADPFSDLLKEDFEAGQTLLIRNSVFQKLGGKSKDPKVIEITKNTIPWAIMEGLAPDTIADLIVNQYYVSLSGYVLRRWKTQFRFFLNKNFLKKILF